MSHKFYNYASSLKGRITLMFVVLALLIEGAMAFYWIYALRPHIEADIVSNITALAQVQGNSIAKVLSENKIDKNNVIKAIDNLFLLKDSQTETPFVSGVELVIDYETINVPQGSLDIRRWQHMAAAEDKHDFYNVEIPLFSNSTKELLGIARFHGSKYSFQRFEKKVRNSFLIATFATMILLLAGWLILLLLLKPLNLLAESLASRHAKEIKPLKSPGKMVSTEIRLVDRTLNELFGKINDYTQELETVNRTLWKSEETYRLFLQNFVGIAYQVDQKTFEFILIHGYVKEISGYDDVEILDRKITRQDLIHPDDLASVMEDLAKLKTDTDYVADNEYRIRRKDGSVCWIRDICRVVNPGKDQPSFLQGAFYDITRSKHLESQLYQAQKMESIGTLAGGIAHDFNNILGIILGNAELSELSLSEGGQVGEFIEEIKVACLRAKKMVAQILAFSRKSDQKFLPVNINNIIEESVKLIRSSIPATVSISLNLPDSENVIIGDKTQISQVMLNLCTNSAHAMRESGGALDISVSSISPEDKLQIQSYDLEQGSYVEIIVRDTGHGINPEIMERIFDPYFTTKEVGEGSGMGLAVVHGIVTSHNGNIHIESNAGNGTTVRIIFPVVHDQQEAGEESSTKLFMGNEKILIADDEKAIITIMTKLFERLGYKVTAGTDPVEILEMFKKDPYAFDLLVTDMAMPGMTGYDLAKEIKLLRPNMPVILCTGYSDVIDEQKAMKLGISKFIMKPLSLFTTAETVRNVLDN